VEKMDNKGKRKIIVIKKVEMDEDNIKKNERIKKIIEGKMFKMKELG
jgi:optic atrophy protein 1